MKTVNEVWNELQHELWHHNDGSIRLSDEGKDILREWANEIIDTCAGNFECTMEWDGSMHPDGVVREYPVLMRGSILAVKNMIK